MLLLKGELGFFIEVYQYWTNRVEKARLLHG